MTTPTIEDARQVAMAHRARGAIVLTFGDGKYALASYGHTRALCRDARQVLDAIALAIESGRIEIPPALGNSIPPLLRTGPGGEYRKDWTL